MTFEFTYEHENKEMTLKEAQAKSVVKTICANFKKWDNLRYSNIEKSQKLIDEIFFKTGKSEYTGDRQPENGRRQKAAFSFPTSDRDCASPHKKTYGIPGGSPRPAQDTCHHRQAGREYCEKHPLSICRLPHRESQEHIHPHI